MRFETRAIHVGEEPNLKEGGTGDVAMPIHLASTYAREKVDTPTAGYEYARTNNPTRFALEKRLASLEFAKHGVVFASGLAAETTIFLSLIQSGDHVIAFDDLYGGTRRLFTRIFQQNFKIEISYVDARQPELVEQAIKPNTKLVWLETPTNPLLKLCDIKTISEIAHKNNLIVAVDNTFMSSYFQKPLALGADIVMHSTTKFLNGHSDSVGGAVMLSDDEMYEKRDGIEFKICSSKKKIYKKNKIHKKKKKNNKIQKKKKKKSYWSYRKRLTKDKWRSAKNRGLQEANSFQILLWLDKLSMN